MALSSKELIARLPAEKQQRVLAKKAEIHQQRMDYKRKHEEAARNHVARKAA